MVRGWVQVQVSRRTCVAVFALSEQRVNMCVIRVT